MNLFERLPKQMEEWKGIGEGSRFFGQPLAEMNREELLAVAGQLIQDKEQAFAARVREREFLAAIRV